MENLKGCCRKNKMEMFIGIGLLAGLVYFGFLGVKLVKDKKSGVIKISAAAIDTARSTGIPLSLIVTQAAHESNYGMSQLANKSNNLFGIKAGGTWPGAFDSYPTNEFINGKNVTVQAKFRKYNSWAESVADWSKLIKSRYPKAYDAALNDQTNLFFQELQNGGYATDPKYAEKLVAVHDSLGELIA